jgi:hypothetical protein
MNRSDFLPFFSSGFVYPQIPLRTRFFAPLPERVLPDMGQGLVLPVFPIRIIRTETAGSPRFLKDPFVCMPCSPTPAGSLRSLSSARRDMAFRIWNSVGSCSELFRGSITRPAHSLCTLRRGSCPTTTQHSVPAADMLSRAGLLTSWILTKGFKSYYCISLLLSQA